MTKINDYIVFYNYVPADGPMDEEKRIVTIQAWDERHAEDRFYVYYKPNIGFNGITRIIQIGKGESK